MSIRENSTHERNTSYFVAQFGGISICGESFQRLDFFPAIRLSHARGFQKLVRIQSTRDAVGDGGAGN
jgi:hypothetical protein